MRKGQFVFNFLRDYMGIGTYDNPYPNCHNVLFNISDEYWKVIEVEYERFKYSLEYKGADRKQYEFPTKPFGDSIISKEHREAISESFKDLLTNYDFKNNKFKDMK